MVSTSEEVLNGPPTTASVTSTGPAAKLEGRRYLAARWRSVPRPARQVCVAVLGAGVLLVGMAMIVLPGPAVVVIPLGFAILATEFHWAAKLVTWAKSKLKTKLARIKKAALSRKPAG